MKILMILFIQVIVSSYCFPDTIVTQNGEIQNGLIVSASDSTVVLRVEIGVLVPIDKKSILSIQFSNADILFFKNGTQLQCKIIVKRGEEIIIVTSEGIGRIKNKEIKTARYSIGDRLNISKLPITSRYFKNTLRHSSSLKTSTLNLFLGFSFETHFALLNDWKKQYVLENNKNPTTAGLQFSGKIGILNKSQYIFGLGYDYFFLPTLKVRSPTFFNDKVSSQFFYLTSGFMHRFASPSPSAMFAGFDIGLLNGRESFDDSQVQLVAKGQTVGVRVKGGYSYDTRAGQLYFELGYLFGKINKVKLIGQKIPDYSLDYSGLTISSGFRFLFPMN